MIDKEKKKAREKRAAEKRSAEKKRVAFWLDPEEMDGVKGRAADLGLTVSDYVRQLLKDDGAFTKL